jgi:hypothetical protein
MWAAAVAAEMNDGAPDAESIHRSHAICYYKSATEVIFTPLGPDALYIQSLGLSETRGGGRRRHERSDSESKWPRALP